MINLYFVLTNKKNWIWKKKEFYKKLFFYFSFDKYFILSKEKFFFNQRKKFIGHEECVKYVCGSKKKNILISISFNNIIKFWDIYSNKVLKSLIFDLDYFEYFELNFNSTILIIFAKNSVSFWTISDVKCLYCIPFHVKPYFLNLLQSSNIFCINDKNELINFFGLEERFIFKKIEKIENLTKLQLKFFFSNFLNFKTFFFSYLKINFIKFYRIFKFKKNLSILPINFSKIKIFLFKHEFRKIPFLKIHNGLNTKIVDSRTGTIINENFFNTKN
jgi:WD40 repeat protein